MSNSKHIAFDLNFTAMFAIAMITLLFIVFSGEPDIIDAIVKILLRMG